MTAIEIRNTSNAVAMPFAVMDIKTKEDTERYMSYATTLVDIADFATSYILKLTRDNVFNHKLKDLIPYAETAFNLKKSSISAKVKFADEFLVDATKTKLLAYYKNGVYVTFADNENEQPNTTECELKDFTYSQINVVASKGIETIRKAIIDGKITPYMSVRAIKSAFDEVEATFTDNGDEATTEATAEATAEAKEEKKTKVVMYVDSENVKHTFDEITANNTDEMVFFKASGEKAYTLTIKLTDLNNGTAKAKVNVYDIEK